MQPKIPSTQANHLLKNARKLLSDHRSRARKTGEVLDYGVLNVQRLLETSLLCFYCSRPVDYSAQIDHRTPIARGGGHRFSNLCIACQRCNALKGMLTESEYRMFYAFLEDIERTKSPVARREIERRMLAGGDVYGRGKKKKKTP